MKPTEKKEEYRMNERKREKIRKLYIVKENVD